MPEKRQNAYKTEEQLKQEARERREAEAKIAAQKPKDPAKLKRENFWYHYKWHTIIGTVLLVMAVFFVKDMFFRTMPDATVVMVSEKYFSSEDAEAIANAIEQLAGDRNGDKKVMVGVDYITLPSDGAETGMAQVDYANTVKLTAILSAGSDLIFLLDEAAYDHIMRMSSQEDESPQTDNIFSAESISASKLGLSQLDGMRFYLLKSVGKDEKYYNYCEELLKIIDRS